MVNRKELHPENGARAAFGARVRKWREERGWSQEALALAMAYSGQHISAIETGRKPPTLPFSRKLDIVFGTGNSADSFEGQWREIRVGSLLEGFPQYVTHEGRATEIRVFEVGIIPGLLQTPEYARVLAESAVRRGTITPSQAEQRVAFLAERQAALVRPRPPMVFVTMDESCVRRPIGGPDVMDAQFASLLEFAERSNTLLQVAPYAIGERRTFDRPVNLLTLADRSVIFYAESQVQGHLDRESVSVLPQLTAYHQLQAEVAVSGGHRGHDQQVAKGHTVTTTTESPRWFKSSYSNNGGTCIEVATNLAASRGVIPVRDSKDPGGPALEIPAAAFASFVTAVKAGEFPTT